MSAPIPLRQDFDASQLRGLAKKTKDGPQARRLLHTARRVAFYCGPGLHSSFGMLFPGAGASIA